MKEAFATVEGVSKVETSLARQEARVRYDPAKVRPEKLAQILTEYAKGMHDYTAAVKE